jgi:hypothetical protein
MALLEKTEIVAALQRLGQLADDEGFQIELLLLGGTAMVLAFNARPSTRDVDAVVIAPAQRDRVRRLAGIVAREYGWPEEWLNDGAKGFLVSPKTGRALLTAPGITVRMPVVEVLLAMKLCAWRDDVDIADARRLLAEMSGGQDDVWARVVAHLQPGRELKARYAFDDLWETRDDPA